MQRQGNRYHVGELAHLSILEVLDTVKTVCRQHGQVTFGDLVGVTGINIATIHAVVRVLSVVESIIPYRPGIIRLTDATIRRKQDVYQYTGRGRKTTLPAYKGHQPPLAYYYDEDGNVGDACREYLTDMQAAGDQWTTIAYVIGATGYDATTVSNFLRNSRHIARKRSDDRKIRYEYRVR